MPCYAVLPRGASGLVRKKKEQGEMWFPRERHGKAG